MKSLAAAVLLCLPLLAGAAERPPCPARMTLAVERELLPVLDALGQASRQNDWFALGYEKAFSRLLKSKTHGALEARVALMDYYVGEGAGEELVCSVASNGSRATRLLLQYSRCDIAPSRSPMTRDHGIPLRAYALRLIRNRHARESCTYE